MGEYAKQINKQTNDRACYHTIQLAINNDWLRGHDQAVVNRLSRLRAELE
jgi:hypothetical protein